MAVPCLACHPASAAPPAPSPLDPRFRIGLREACADCHAADDPHGGQFAGRACDECHDDRSFYIGRFDYRTGEYIACIPRFMEVADRYPDSGLADKALYLVIKANLELDRLEAAKQAYSTLTTKYPDSKYVKGAERKLLRAVKKS